jgi:hypothetical protein
MSILDLKILGELRKGSTLEVANRCCLKDWEASILNVHFQPGSTIGDQQREVRSQFKPAAVP